ncbi:enoyl-CoA hydratase-related protein [Amycolatopsis endophytica]
MTGFTNLTFTVSDRIATVLLNRPPVNAVTQQMYREITEFFSTADEVADAVVLSGAGRHFCGGNDLDEFATLTPENSDARMEVVRTAFFAIQDCAVPVIGAVNGTAVGTGLAIAASCDFVIAADDARLGTPEIGVGVMGGARHLARLVPEPWVRCMYLTGDPLPASALRALGGIVDVCSSEDLIATAQDWARRIVRHSGAAIRMAKRSLKEIETMDIKAGYTFEQGLTREFSGHPDSREAVRALLERRSPEFGRAT